MINDEFTQAVSWLYAIVVYASYYHHSSSISKGEGEVVKAGGDRD